MKLTVKDRLIIPSIFGEGDFLAIAIQRDIRKKIEIGAEERAAINMVDLPDGQGVRWDENAGPGEFDFSDAELAHLKKLANDMNMKRRVNEENYDTLQAILSEK